ncbi:MAG: carboxypeptidase regulatory-like domain-containing protein [Candidatus Eremiobacteraeota bacterium]|nr:carboxypeptidase regulatory-like domain-containing protein [Candidatus Eremiobacteraeota bacterium]MBV8365856.1 carboxypeptidase regulatory-like domain-containing protein [Candidatus Eremiobacteraeota bacterium]
MSRTQLLVTVALAALIASGCGNPSNNPVGDYGSVAGVVSSASGPVSGAQVCIDTICQTTAADGTYKIQTVPADPPGLNETITVVASGYQNFSGQVHVTAGQQTPFNITLNH